MTLSIWPKHPFVYEINTWVWLNELSHVHGSPVTLANIPDNEWDLLADLHPDAVWLMGVWERSPIGINIAKTNTVLIDSFRQALPDFETGDIVGSPYCIRNYTVDCHLGGTDGLAIARERLAERKMGLILDYVPNHVAPDHPWVSENPNYFVRGTREDVSQAPDAFMEINGQVFARGRDPYFPAWPDVLQLNAFSLELRKASAETLKSILSQCDGVRCDMAMLLLNSIFERTWGDRAGVKPDQDYWPEVIGQVKEQNPKAKFFAEAYWDLEWELMQQGFDYCYDKRLYDRLEREDANSVRLHLQADLSYQDKLLRFIENHDEPRAAAAFSPGKELAAAVVTMTLPGSKLIHEGQLEGRKVRLPVFLGRRPNEPIDMSLKTFYEKLLRAIHAEAIRNGDWHLCQQNGWPDNQSQQNILAWSWHKDNDQRLIVINLSSTRSQGLIQVSLPDLIGRKWQLRDVISGQEFDRDGNEMVGPGLYVDLEGWEMHFLKFIA